MVMREGQMVSLKNQPSVMNDDFSLEVIEKVPVTNESAAEMLVPC
jgi:hypothetical protein